MYEARLWKSIDESAVQCRLCHHFCAIQSGERGKCGVRENRNGTLFSLNYGKIAAINLDPVEKKPLYHFHPASQTFSLATMGCNLACSFCQNWTLSQPPAQDGTIQGTDTTPRQLVDEALRRKAASISYTYSEPTIFFELMQDTAQLAQQANLSNILVSNGFMTRECLDELGPLINAANIDLKCFTEDFYAEIAGARLQPVLDNLRHIKKALGWWLEVTTLLIPGKNDSPEELNQLAEFIASELGPETPWHISRFHPNFKMTNVRATESDCLTTAYAIGKEKGLEYVYIGNLPSCRYQNTLCPQCNETLINREGFFATQPNTQNSQCIACGKLIAGIGLP